MCPHKVIAILAAACLPLGAQTVIHSSVTGRVLDPAGVPVPNVKLTATVAPGGIEHQAATDDQGIYQFPRLTPGQARLIAEKDGFQRVVREGIALAVGTPAVVDLRLEVGSLSTSVTVSGAAAVVQSTESNLGLLIDGQRLQDLPINARDFQKLIFLSPGIGGQRSNNTVANNSSSGSRDLMNNYMIDGMTINDERQTSGPAPATAGHSGTRVPNVISMEALAEFRIVTTNADATYGRSSGAQINATTKSGSNTLHGSAYEYWRNDNLDSRDFFNTGPFFDSKGRSVVPPFNQNLFGATLGGPLLKNRHFYFGSYEGFRQRLLATDNLVLPNADLIRLVPGDLGGLYEAYYFGLNVIPQTGNMPGEFRGLTAAERAAATSAGFPSALFDAHPSNGEAGNVLSGQASRRDFDHDALLFRTDHYWTRKWQTSVRYANTAIDRTSSTGSLPGTMTATKLRLRSGVVQNTFLLSPTQVFEVRAGLMRSKNENVLLEHLDSFYAVGVDPENGIGFTVNAAAIRPPSLSPNPALLDNQIIPQISALHTWQRGSMTLRYGLDLRQIRINFGNMNFRTPSYTFTGLVGPNGVVGTGPGTAQASAQVANQLQLGVNNGPTTALRAWRSTQQEYFTQLDWRATPTLTLNLGIRYAYFSPYHEAGGYFSNLYAVDASGAVQPGVSPLDAPASAILPTSGRRLYEPDRNNFQPRVGMAWRFSERGNQVVRAAYGVYIDRVVQLGMSNMTNNPPYAIEGTASNLPFLLNQRLSTVARTPNIFAVDPGLRSPVIHRWNVAYERELDRDTSVTAAYVASRGRGLVRYVEPNFGSGMPQNLRPDSRFAWVRVYGNYSYSDYDSLQVLLRRRFSKGLTITSTYTYARFFDDASADAEFSSRAYLYNAGASPAAGYQGGVVGGRRPIAADFSHSELEAPHVFTFSGVYDLPFGRRWPRVLGGWSVSPVLLFRTGNTFNVTTGTDYNDDGAFDDRPALFAGSTLGDLRFAAGDKTQFLAPINQATTMLGTPASVNDPSLAIPRNAFRAPAIYNVDVSLAKRVAITEHTAARFELNAFNVFNRPHLGIPSGTLTSAFFGQITSTLPAMNPRQVQLGAKLTF